MQIAISYAIKTYPYEAYLLSEGSLRNPSKPHICIFSRREIGLKHLDKYFLLSSFFSKSNPHVTQFGREMLKSFVSPSLCYVGQIDTQIEFVCSSATISAIHEVANPAIDSNETKSYLSEETTGFVVLLRVYVIDRAINSKLLEKGRKSPARIYRLSNASGMPVRARAQLLAPVIPDGVFEQIRAEVIHAIRARGAVIGIYDNNQEGRALLFELGTTRRALRADVNSDSESVEDFAQFNYTALYDSVLQNCPGMRSIVAYIKEVRPAQYGEIPLLVHEAKAGDQQAFERLFDVHLRAILKQSYQFHQRYNLDIEVLFQEGVLGYQTGFLKFNEDAGSAFGQYVGYWIMQNIMRNVVYNYGTMYVPTNLMTNVVQMRQRIMQHACVECKQDSCEELTNEIISMLGCNSNTAERIIALCLPSLSLDNMNISEDTGMVEYSFSLNRSFLNARVHIGVTQIDSLLESVYREQLAREVKQALANLTSREATVLEQRFGLKGNEKTLEEVGKNLSVTRERIRQVQAKALKKLHRSRLLEDWQI